jgi:hypothetical protein
MIFDLNSRLLFFQKFYQWNFFIKKIINLVFWKMSLFDEIVVQVQKSFTKTKTWN